METKELEKLSSETNAQITKLESDKAGLVQKLGEECSSLPKKDIKNSRLKDIIQEIEQSQKDIKAANKVIESIRQKKLEIEKLDQELKEIRDKIDELNLVFDEKQSAIGREFYSLIHDNPDYSTFKDLYADYENTKKEISDLQENLRATEEEEKGFFKKIKEKFNVMIIKNNIKTKEKELNNLYPVIGRNLIQGDFFEKLNEPEHKELKKLIIDTKSKLAKQQRDEKDNIMLKEKKSDELAQMIQHNQPEAFIKEKENEIKAIEKDVYQKYADAGQLIYDKKMTELIQKKEHKDIFNSIAEIDKNIGKKNQEIEQISFAIEYINKNKILAELKNKEERINNIIEQNKQELKAIQNQISETEKQVEITKNSAGNFIEM